MEGAVVFSVCHSPDCSEFLLDFLFNSSILLEEDQFPCKRKVLFSINWETGRYGRSGDTKILRDLPTHDSSPLQQSFAFENPL